MIVQTSAVWFAEAGMLCALKRYCLIPSGAGNTRVNLEPPRDRGSESVLTHLNLLLGLCKRVTLLAMAVRPDLQGNHLVSAAKCKRRKTKKKGNLGRTFLYIQRKASPSRAHPAVASAQNTPATMWPPVKREMRLISPAEPDEGMPMNLFSFCHVNQRRARETVSTTTALGPTYKRRRRRGRHRTGRTRRRRSCTCRSCESVNRQRDAAQGYAVDSLFRVGVVHGAVWRRHSV